MGAKYIFNKELIPTNMGWQEHTPKKEIPPHHQVLGEFPACWPLWRILIPTALLLIMDSLRSSKSPSKKLIPRKQMDSYSEMHVPCIHGNMEYQKNWGNPRWCGYVRDGVTTPVNAVQQSKRRVFFSGHGTISKIYFNTICVKNKKAECAVWVNTILIHKQE